MRARAVVRLRFPSEKHLSIVLSALKPETEVSLTSRARVELKSEGNSLTMKFEASDTSALRAAMNSYLHWIVLVNEACSVVESLSK